MNKEQIIEKLKELGIVTSNCYPKASFPKDGVICVGLFASEMEGDFYFYNSYDKKIYLLKEGPSSLYPTEEFRGKKKYIVPLANCSMIWEDKPFEEQPDVSYRDITLRQYACIHLKVAESGLPWLDTLITKAK